MIDAFYKKNFWYFSSIQFDYVNFYFSDGGFVRISRKVDQEEFFDDLPDSSSGRLLFEFHTPSGHFESWEPTLSIAYGQANMIARFLPFLTRVSPNKWIDDRTGELLRTEEVVEQNFHLLPPDLVPNKTSTESEIYNGMIGGVECHLIETQRLLSLPSEGAGFDSRSKSKSKPDLVVQKKALRLKTILQRQLAHYASISQKLDRTFPARVIENRRITEIDIEELVHRFTALEDKRKFLQSAGIIDTEVSQLGLPDRFDKEIAKLLRVYISDTEEKLSIFDDIQERIEVFVRIISDRFLDKTVQVDRECGFRIVTYYNEDVPLDKLSSGEQHQLVMVFELLFEMSKNSIILIDEPELSLHVGWQKRFVSDLLEIIALNELDVVLATHSPQLIGRWRSLTVELGSVE
tara:strand:+ start:627 stop:1841 length:1215 start_codon:yes stop_codon:yes gene_type:complete